MSDSEEIITTSDFIKRQLDQEAEAREVLPGNFNKCTFIDGPLNQPIYVCLTCKEDPHRLEEGPAGICYSCSISCHSDHELLELFNKRGYTCECGTKKFPYKCKLEKGIITGPFSESSCHPVDAEGWRKTVTTNIYSQNHEGLYCWCEQKYDPQTEEDLMIQCLDCQDWYHKRCIGAYDFEEDGDFICSTCVEKHPILPRYILLGKLIAIQRPILPSSSIPIAENQGLKSVLTAKRAREEESTTDLSDSVNTPELKRQQNQLDVSPKTSSAEAFSACRAPETGLDYKDISVFALENWRKDLCNCEKCLNAYVEQDMSHLIEKEDIFSPEADAEPALSIHDAGLEALSCIPHEKAIEVTAHMDSFRSRMREFLAPFAASGKVVTKDDVSLFFKRGSLKEN